MWFELFRIIVWSSAIAASIHSYRTEARFAKSDLRTPGCHWVVTPWEPAATGTYDAERHRFYPPYATPTMFCWQVGILQEPIR